jgi:hypothetical protein
MMPANWLTDQNICCLHLILAPHHLILTLGIHLAIAHCILCAIEFLLVRPPAVALTLFSTVLSHPLSRPVNCSSEMFPLAAGEKPNSTPICGLIVLNPFQSKKKGRAHSIRLAIPVAALRLSGEKPFTLPASANCSLGDKMLSLHCPLTDQLRLDFFPVILQASNCYHTRVIGIYR